MYVSELHHNDPSGVVRVFPLVMSDSRYQALKAISDMQASGYRPRGFDRVMVYKLRLNRRYRKSDCADGSRPECPILLELRWSGKVWQVVDSKIPHEELEKVKGLLSHT